MGSRHFVPYYSPRVIAPSWDVSYVFRRVMSKYLILFLTLCCSFFSKADYDPAVTFTCNFKKMDSVSPYYHYLARLSHLRTKLVQQQTNINLDELDALLLDTIKTIKKSGCNGEATLEGLKKLKEHFNNAPVQSKELSKKLNLILTEMGV